MYAMKDEIDHLKKNFQKLYRFSCQKVTSGSGTIIPDADPTCPKSSGSGSTTQESGSKFRLLMTKTKKNYR
jgi:hypothetical protein